MQAVSAEGKITSAAVAEMSKSAMALGAFDSRLSSGEDS
ncbi:MAG: hypothetical protein BMS9Abin37_3139 [Acidobacteriota bacterium]|nr:MAG: hypothetical protein BMS9Abin37_3139 [Acidobacteriota bacterium]